MGSESTRRVIFAYCFAGQNAYHCHLRTKTHFYRLDVSGDDRTKLSGHIALGNNRLHFAIRNAYQCHLCMKRHVCSPLNDPGCLATIASHRNDYVMKCEIT